jgi:hypothetical protein
MLNVPELFRKSVYSPEFYRGLLDEPFSFSIRYFYTLVLTLSLALTLMYSLTVLPAAYLFLRDLGPRMAAEYPADLVIEVANGEAKMNRAEPFAVPLPERLRDSARAAGMPSTNLIVVDPSVDYNINKFREYDSLMWLSKHEFVFANKENDIRTTDLAGTEFRLDRALVAQAAAATQGFARWSPVWIVLAVLFMIVAFVVLLSGELGYLLIGALFIWAILRFRGVAAGYKKSYQIGLHAVSIGVLIDAVAYLAGGAPVWLGMTVALIIVWFNFDPRPLIPVAESV